MPWVVPTGAALLASAAKYGGFEDRNNDNAVDLTGSQTCTYPAGSNLGSGSGTSNPEWDLDGPASVPDCVPDTFFDASEGGDLEAQINAAIAAILKKAASGTSISVLASSSTGEGALFQAFFYPSTFEGSNEIKWTGYVQGLFVDPFGNLREDRGGCRRRRRWETRVQRRQYRRDEDRPCLWRCLSRSLCRRESSGRTWPTARHPMKR